MANDQQNKLLSQVFVYNIKKAIGLRIQLADNAK